ncbi:Hypothetical protein IALB_0424 [Ignavibacterium album JCM 16511]|uniref:Uncharacterized protein n=1 Tax=Ignavibacterium album (strain DSM 19864 / JCM 16511 / NBRC 101810 / Mat9-16) TaxID=945713 RepID=I0AGM9_IGNAJ|nr:Hypothetical protein IALB_0424 [Ignavibacterium album JCM 16511]
MYFVKVYIKTKMNTKKYYMTSLNNFYNMFWVKTLISVLFLFFASCDVNDVGYSLLLSIQIFRIEYIYSKYSLKYY